MSTVQPNHERLLVVLLEPLTTLDPTTGEVKPVRMLGRDFVIYRGTDGAVRVLDAYCPHLGAHLGYGGKVVEKLIA